MRSTFLAEPDIEGLAPRAAAKARRRVDLLRASAKIMADTGFHAMRLEDLGEAVGISGPAVYRHFSSKEQILRELLLGISTHLNSQAREVIDGAATPQERVSTLIDFHISFALHQPELIRLHNRELFRLGMDGHAQVRHAQGQYLQLWAQCLQLLDPALDDDGAKVKAQLIIGLINSVEYLRLNVPRSVVRRQMSESARAVAGLHT
ncbi:TetR family transcriptional regulator [Corynebacterium sp. zg254]|uniref:TetR/AcrR family transcriptional regulator n=1 Tax=Corynebacterium sp. zg254 TaxID=2656645 RepID=UPI002150D17F|nr:TetR/AcrR family transcriptional regulator [Corynebacterium sp. zg254]MCR5913893.1 TetR family transcriptional regulator [Corynebacterium sp. zg254]